jgi:hypothetical protein
VLPSDSRRFAQDARALQFDALRAAYRQSGGTASGDHFALMLRRYLEQPLSQLARWIVGREVVSFEYLGTTWLPLFQFDRAVMSVRPEVTAVVRVAAHERSVATVGNRTPRYADRAGLACRLPVP